MNNQLKSNTDPSFDFINPTEIEADWLSRWNLYSPHKEALFDYKNKKSYTYHQLWKASVYLADYFSKLGVERGDRVSVLSQNRVETVILFFALQRIGGVLVPINFRLSVSEINYVLKDADPKFLIYEDYFKNLIDQFNSISKINYDGNDGISKFLASVLNSEKEDESDSNLNIDPNFKHNDDSIQDLASSKFKSHFDSSCMILYTSGTTGFPKGAVLTNKMLFWNAVNTTLSLNVTQEDVTINFAPLFHTGGWNVLLTPFIFRGARTIFFEKFDAIEILKVSVKEKVTLLFGVPTMLSMMAETKEFKNLELSSIRYMIVGGEPMPLELIKIWNQKGVPVRQGFGLTEFGPNCFSLSEKDAELKMGSIGRANFFVKTKIINQQGFEVKSNEVGELLLSGPSCMKEYWNNLDATNETIQNGWLHTGDLVKKDDQEYFYVVGRKKEMFISGGENIYPVEVEKILRSHPLVTEAAVVGIKDQKWGEVGHAFVALKKDNSKMKITEFDSTHVSNSDLEIELNDKIKNELKEFCRIHLASYKVPKFFTLLNELPKGDSGKINKKVLLSEDFKGVFDASH